MTLTVGEAKQFELNQVQSLVCEVSLEEGIYTITVTFDGNLFIFVYDTSHRLGDNGGALIAVETNKTFEVTASDIYFLEITYRDYNSLSADNLTITVLIEKSPA